MGKLIPIFVLFVIMLSLNVIPNVYADANPTKENNNINLVIIEAESNPSGKDAGNEWIKIFNPTSEDVDINGMVIKSTHGRTESYSISQQMIINPCTSTVIILPGQFLDNQDESAILLDSNGEVVDRTPSFSDSGNDSLTWKTQIPSCTDNKENQSTQSIDKEISSVKSSDNSTIPGWIKTNAGWWANDEIDDNTFVSGIQYLIKEKIISVSSSSSSTSDNNTTNEIPGWIKNNADWWSQEMISDEDFIKGIEFLVENGIITVQ
ncbi:lamin tail domain-containing protein [Nitrosopumilus sp.]|uniref:lamin tail domain-containing protein n=1 Tax=Nitrosopumilus sp. TaxID=2024843 RepID=UPI002931708E|nr:lamin tail domain-containing protein [Nitrosopumilus sp.]